MKCSPDILKERDVKGFYRKAQEQQIKSFTGIDDPYEEPLTPEIIVDSGKMTVADARDLICNYLEKRGLVRNS